MDLVGILFTIYVVIFYPGVEGHSPTLFGKDSVGVQVKVPRVKKHTIFLLQVNYETSRFCYTIKHGP